MPREGRSVLTKTCPATIKAAGPDDGLAEGEYRALVSVFGNRDSYGDVVLPGAFKETLAEWKASGDPIPIYWSHQMHDPMMNLGHVIDAKETSAGLEVHGKLDLENPKAAQVYKLFKGRRVTQQSFSYDVLDGGWSAEDEDAYELRALKLYEVGPTPIGANQETDLLAVKAFTERATRIAGAVKAGRVLSGKNGTILRDAHEQLLAAASSIHDVLAALGESEDDQGKASATGPVKVEEPAGAKTEEPSRGASVDTWAVQLSLRQRREPCLL
jgi:HK97 family phage prohead protease